MSGDILYATSYSNDDKNCITFYKDKFGIQVNGPQIMQPGLSYNYSVELEIPGEGIEITPFVNVNGIIFDPAVLVFNYSPEPRQTFLVKIVNNILPGNYYIRFNKIEKLTYNFNKTKN